MKKIKVPNADGTLVEVEVSEEIYDIYVYDKYKEKQRELYKNTHLQDYTELNSLEEFVISSGNDIDRALNNIVVMDNINTVLEQCTETQKRRFFLWFFEEKTYMEIAHIEKVKYKSVYKSIEEVRKKFKKFFQKGV